MLSVSVLSSTVSVSLMWHVGLDPDAVKDGRIKMAGGDGDLLGGGDSGGPAARGRVAHAHHRVALHAQFSQFSAGRGGLNALSARPLSSLVSL